MRGQERHAGEMEDTRENAKFKQLGRHRICFNDRKPSKSVPSFPLNFYNKILTHTEGGGEQLCSSYI